jgi:hypothetical protein
MYHLYNIKSCQHRTLSEQKIDESTVIKQSLYIPNLALLTITEA